MIEHEMASWNDFKDLVVTKKNLSLQEKTFSGGGKDFYEIWAEDGNARYYCIFQKKETPDDPSDQKDYEDNHQASANWAIGHRPYPFATGDFEFNGESTGLVTATKTTTTDHDFLISESLYINGGEIITEGSEIGDTCQFQVVDVDGVYAPAGTVLKTWINKWGVYPGKSQSIETAYAGVVPAGAYLRVKYTSIGVTNDVKLVVNYRLHRSV
jgi:hypothetical protein